MYKMMSSFLNDVFKHIDKTGNLRVRTNDKRGDVFVGYYRKDDLRKDKIVFCYRGEMFFIPPDAFQIFEPPMYRLGPHFNALDFGKVYECCFSGNKRQHSNGKTLLREIVSIHDEAPNIFKREPFNKAYIQDKYAGWLEELSDYYGGQTELWTDSRGAFTLVRTNGEVIAVVLEVRV